MFLVDRSCSAKGGRSLQIGITYRQNGKSHERAHAHLGMRTRSWVVGSVPFVGIEVMSAEQYATPQT